MATSVALAYYANPDHYSIDQKNREWLIREGYEKLMRQASIPINVGFLGSTLKEISEQSPLHLGKFNDLKSVKYFFASYSHYFIHEFDKDVALQVAYGKKYISKLLRKSKLMNIFAFPEYDFPKNYNLHEKQNNRFDFFLCLSSALNHSSLAKCGLVYNVTPRKHKALCVHKNLSYRMTLHKYFREECSPQKVIAAIKSDIHNIGNQSLIICAIDLEIPILNRVYFKPNLLSPPRLDLLGSLFQAFARSDLLFVHLDSPIIRTIESKKHIKRLTPTEASVEKSSHYKKVYQFLKANRKALLKCTPLKYLECTTSDFFTYNQNSLIYPASYKKRKGRVIIRRSGLKKETLNLKLKHLKNSLVNLR